MIITIGSTSAIVIGQHTTGVAGKVHGPQRTFGVKHLWALAGTGGRIQARSLLCAHLGPPCCCWSIGTIWGVETVSLVASRSLAPWGGGRLDKSGRPLGAPTNKLEMQMEAPGTGWTWSELLMTMTWKTRELRMRKTDRLTNN